MPRITPLELQGPAGALEAELVEPDTAPSFVATVAHPHPLHGGDMDNHVVAAAAEAVVESGGAALRFNFRGVGQSGGHHDEGRGERDDLAESEAELGRRFPELPRLSVGYSFGAVVSMGRKLQTSGERPAGLLLIAPPLTHYDFEAAREATAPIAVVYGQLDAFTPVAMIRRLPRRWPTLGACFTIPGVGHDLSSPHLQSTIRQAIELLLAPQADPAAAASAPAFVDPPPAVDEL